MAWVPIATYYLRYNTSAAQPVVGVFYREGGSPEGRMISQHFSMPADHARYVADLLRNEEPVFFDPENGAIASGKEIVGEGEMAAGSGESSSP